jgi:hypothetical protein
MSQTDTPGPTDTATEAADTPENESKGKGNKGNKGKVAAVAGAGAAVAGLAGGIAVAARDSRRRVLGMPIGKRSRVEETASSVVEKVGEPARKVGARFSRD